MSGRLNGKVIAVTGASGMAAAAARRFADEGAKVFVVSLDPDECQTLADAITTSGGVCEWVAADLTDEVAAETAFAATTRLGPLDGLLAVAGGSGRPFGMARSIRFRSKPGRPRSAPMHTRHSSRRGRRSATCSAGGAGRL